MATFTTLSSHAVLLPVDNIDTDQIIPARFLKTTEKAGLAKDLFHDWRYADDGSDRPDFVLNQPGSAGAQVLVAGDNFGCGSSREHAPWALTGWGFRVVVSTSFADIFQNNALKNGLLPVVLDAATHAALVAALRADPSLQLGVDLERTEITLPDGSRRGFPVDAFARRCLLEGKDELGYLLGFDAQLRAYEAAHV